MSVQISNRVGEVEFEEEGEGWWERISLRRWLKLNDAIVERIEDRVDVRLSIQLI